MSIDYIQLTHRIVTGALVAHTAYVHFLKGKPMSLAQTTLNVIAQFVATKGLVPPAGSVISPPGTVIPGPGDEVVTAADLASVTTALTGAGLDANGLPVPVTVTVPA